MVRIRKRIRTALSATHRQQKGKGKVMSSLILSSSMFYGGDMGEFESQRARISEWKCMAMAYVWGRQDAGDSDRDTGYSQHFAEVYALANVVSGGTAGPLQAAYHEWHDTRRILVSLRSATRTGIAAVHVARCSVERAECHVIPWAGEPFLPRYWPGLIGKPIGV